MKMLTEQDIYLFREGNHFRAYEKLGAHFQEGAPGQNAGTRFAVWAADSGYWM